MDKPTSLIDFEKNRKLYGNKLPEKSTSFYTISNNGEDGSITLFCESTDPELFDLYLMNGVGYTGNGIYSIDNNPYRALYISDKSRLNVDNTLRAYNGSISIHGVVEFTQNSTLMLSNNSQMILYSDSTVIIPDDYNIQIDESSEMKIYGKIIISLDSVDTILHHEHIYIDSAAVVVVKDINLGDREYSLTDYDIDLRDTVINRYSQGEHNSRISQIGYRWRDGSPLTSSQVIDISTIWGEAVLGDFKFSVLGTQKEIVSGLQVVRLLEIEKNTTLYITDSYRGFTYLYPELYLGIIIGNCDTPGACVVNGTIICSGSTAKISLDRGGSLTINGEVYLDNNASIICSYAEDSPVLKINGILTIDTIDQLKSFNTENIEFGENGKLVILNKYNTRTLLWTTPNGIHNTELYRLFNERLEHIEYHISSNCGIAIDKYYEFYNIDMREWYNGMRLEHAIHEGLIVWHDNAFIEFNSNIIPWVDNSCTLYAITKIFKSYGVTDQEKLQEIVERFKFAGSGNIQFRFIDGKSIVDVSMDLNSASVKSVLNKPMSDSYNITVDGDGNLFMRNKVESTEASYLISEKSKKFMLSNGTNEINLK